MMRYLWSIIGLVLCLFAQNALGGNYKPGFVELLVTDQLIQPTSLAIAPDGRIFVSEKAGVIRIIENGVLLSTPFIRIDVDLYGERGLSSILLDPDFDSNGYVYAYYSVPEADRNRLSRFTANGNVVIPGSEVVLVDFSPLGAAIHNGGAMRWGNDGKLYISTGDGGSHEKAQSMEVELGKLLRLNKDGSIPNDNPFYNSVSGINRAIYALGFRNPFTFDIDPASGRILLNDVGNADAEEVNDVRAGKNYGWPIIEGMRDNEPAPADYRDPLVAYGHDAGCAVVGGVAYNYPATDYPEEIQNHYLFADYCMGVISMMDLATNAVTDTFATGLTQVTNMVVDPATGILHFLEFTAGKLWQVQYIGTGAPFISEQPSDQLVPVGETAVFSCSAVSADSIYYQWYRDSSPIPGEVQSELRIPSTILADSGALIRVLVYNHLDTVLSESAVLGVTSNLRPLITITSPDSTDLYFAGQIIYYAGTAIDPETGAIPNDRKFWRVDFHHDEHIHPFIPETAGGTWGSFSVPTVGETDTTVWYRIHHYAIDEKGMAGSDYVDIYPLIGRFGLATIPSGLHILHNGESVKTPLVLPGVPGMRRVVVAPEFAFRNDSLFRFVQWRDSTEDRRLEITIPHSFVEFVAEYEYLGTYVLGEGDGLLAEYWNNLTLSCRSSYSTVDTVIDFRYGEGLARNVIDRQQAEFLGADTFATRWTGDLLAPVTGIYTFDLTYDDRVRFYLDGKLLLDDFENEGESRDSVKFSMVAGRRYPIQIDYAEINLQSTLIFKWTQPWMGKGVVPKSQLYSASTRPSAFHQKMPNICLFPVPFGDELNVSIQGLSGPELEEVMLEIFDSMGNLVKSATVRINSANPGKVDVSDLEQGAVYIVRITHGTEVAVAKGTKIK